MAFFFLEWPLFIHINLILTTQVYCDVFTHAGDLMLAHLLNSENIASTHCTDQALDRHEVGSTIHNTATVEMQMKCLKLNVLFHRSF